MKATKSLKNLWSRVQSLNPLEAAGGIGGLLALDDLDPATPQEGGFLYFYDGNGNVGQLLDADDGTLAVKYQYDPYGARASLPLPGELNQPFRFSTKYLDAETGLYYFGYRYYHPKLGRWMSRDPIEEEDAYNLYACVRNRPVDRTDPSGLATACVYTPAPRPGGGLEPPTYARMEVRVCHRETIILPIAPGTQPGRALVLVCNRKWIGRSDRGVAGLPCRCSWSVRQLCRKVCCTISFFTGKTSMCQSTVVLQCDEFGTPSTYGVFGFIPQDPWRGFDCNCPEPSGIPTHQCCHRGIEI